MRVVPVHSMAIKMTMMFLSGIELLLLLTALPETVGKALRWQADAGDIGALLFSLFAVGLLPAGILGVSIRKTWGYILMIAGNVAWFSWVGASLDVSDEIFKYLLNALR